MLAASSISSTWYVAVLGDTLDESDEWIRLTLSNPTNAKLAGGEGFGIIGQLGFIPEDIPFDALELSRRVSPEEAEDRFGRYRSIPWITSSDAHSIDEVGARTITLSLYHSTFEEIRLALRGGSGRKVAITR